MACPLLPALSFHSHSSFLLPRPGPLDLDLGPLVVEMGSDFKLFGRSIPFDGDCDSPLSHSEKCGDGSVDPGRSGKKDAGAMEKASMSVKCSEILAMPEGGGMVVGKEGGAGVEASNMVKEKDNERNRIINNGEENAMKRPEMLLLCPRCESLDTKFCYFNNCNANQPRHFCKSCQRYWTAGGTLRNVPMGSGRRKSKKSSAFHPHNHPHHFLNSNNDGLSVQSDVLASAQQLPPAGDVVLTTSTTGRHLKMGPSLPASEIPEFEQNAAGQDGLCATHGFSNGSCKTYALNERQSPPNSDELACGSSVGAHTQACETTEAPKQQPVPFSLPLGPWPYGYGVIGWNNGSNSEVDKSLATPSEAWCGNPWMGGVLPWPLMPFPSWAPPGSWGGRPWNMPLMPPLPPWGFPMLPTTVNGNSPTLGKHPREGAPNGCLLTPKVLRIHDPKEAAQSSIWSALGLDNNNNRFDLRPCGIFKGFPPKANTEAENEELSARAFYANPAAMTRSVAFQENT